MAGPILTSTGSEYNQSSFLGGMNLLGDDSRLSATEYRAGFNLTNRYDVLDPVLQSQLDTAAPTGLIQECTTFGNYILLFVSGKAYYRYYTDVGWQAIPSFSMSPTAPRYWTQAVPVSETNYLRLSVTGSITSTPDPRGGIQLASILSASQGNLPGLLVQDNINQPQFIFLDSTGYPTTRVTQTFAQWSIAFTDANNTVVATNGDKREYVPIGNSMTFNDGILYITSQDFSKIYRSVSGRPLDFVVNVTNNLITTAPYTMYGGGDASTTAYSVGAYGITCLRAMSSGGIFVAAGGSNFAVTKNMTQNAPTLFGEYTFIRTFLFNANCLSDRAIMDTIGDTRFIDLTGVRSFNSIAQTQNEGRNTPFTAKIQAAFGSDITPIVQDPNATACILYNDYELYAVNTIFGPAIAKYDTINNCWTSFDTNQVGGKAIKILSKIELAVQRLFAITSDNKLYTLYIGPETSTATFRTIGVCANILYANTNIRMANPKNEIKLAAARAVINKITENSDCSFTPFVNNRLGTNEIVKSIHYSAPTESGKDSLSLLDTDTLLINMLYSVPNCKQGWKIFGIFSWTNGSFTQVSFELVDITPMNPLLTQKRVT